MPAGNSNYWIQEPELLPLQLKRLLTSIFQAVVELLCVSTPESSEIPGGVIQTREHLIWTLWRSSERSCSLHYLLEDSISRSQTIQFLSSTNTAWSFTSVLLQTHIQEHRNRWNTGGVHSSRFQISALVVRGIRMPMHRLRKENLPSVLLQSCMCFSRLLRNTELVMIKLDYLDLKKGTTSKATCLWTYINSFTI